MSLAMVCVFAFLGPLLGFAGNDSVQQFTAKIYDADSPGELVYKASYQRKKLDGKGLDYSSTITTLKGVVVFEEKLLLNKQGLLDSYTLNDHIEQKKWALIRKESAFVMRSGEEEKRIDLSSDSRPYLAPPMLDQLARHHWSAFFGSSPESKGEGMPDEVSFNFVLLDRMRTLEFDLQLETKVKKQTQLIRYALRPSSFLIRAFVPSIFFEFDRKGRVVEFEGPAFVKKQSEGGVLESFRMKALYTYN